MIRVKRLLGILIPVVASFTIIGTGFSAFYFGNGLNRKDADVSANVQKKVPSSFGSFTVGFKLEEHIIDNPSFLIWQNEVEGPDTITLTYTFDPSLEKEGDFAFADFTYQIHYKLSINDDKVDASNPNEKSLKDYFQFDGSIESEGEGYVEDDTGNNLIYTYDPNKSINKIEVDIPFEIVYRPGMVPSSHEEYRQLANKVYRLEETTPNKPFISYEFSLIPTLPITGGN